MSFRNAVKILLSRFGLVWTILLYTVIFVFVLACLSVTFVVPVVRALDAAGVGDSLSALFNSVLSGDSMQSWFEQIKAIVDTAGTTIRSDFSARLNTWLAVVVFVLAGRFLVGLYELPLVSVLESSMSSDAKVGFTGRFISRLGVSCRFTLVKMIYTILFDAVLYAILYAMFGLFSVRGFGLLAAPLIMLTFIALNAFRYAVISMWAPSVIVDGKKIFPAFFSGAKSVFRHFGSIYSSYVVSWVLIVALNLLVGLFTFGVGLLITVPISMTFLSILGMTVFYGKNGRRYYADSSIVYPQGAGN